VEVDSRARMVKLDNSPMKNVFAAGGIKAGNVLTRGCLAVLGNPTLVIHLGVTLSLFLTTPFTKLIHTLLRYLPL
jgi:nitrate reductase gamma subunit